MPGDGKLEKKNDLIQIVASIIFLSSVGHASANFNQYDEYAFPPNYPAILRGKQPTTKVHFIFLNFLHRALMIAVHYFGLPSITKCTC